VQARDEAPAGGGLSRATVAGDEADASHVDEVLEARPELGERGGLVLRLVLDGRYRQPAGEGVRPGTAEREPSAVAR
jgi:hypothetical protein